MPTEEELLEHFCAYEDAAGDTHYAITLSVTENIRDQIIAVCLHAGIDVADFIGSGIAAVAAASKNPQSIAIVNGFSSKN